MKYIAVLICFGVWLVFTALSYESFVSVPDEVVPFIVRLFFSVGIEIFATGIVIFMGALAWKLFKNENLS
jgi:hypothetical protein